LIGGEGLRFFCVHRSCLPRSQSHSIGEGYQERGISTVVAVNCQADGAAGHD
jgi:hypothetical protein